MARAESSAQLCNFTTPVGGIRSRISHGYCIRSTIALPGTTPPVRNHIKTRTTVRPPLDRDRAQIRDWPQNKGGRLQGGANTKVLPTIHGIGCKRNSTPIPTCTLPDHLKFCSGQSLRSQRLIELGRLVPRAEVCAPLLDWECSNHFATTSCRHSNLALALDHSMVLTSRQTCPSLWRNCPSDSPAGGAYS